MANFISSASAVNQSLLLRAWDKILRILWLLLWVRLGTISLRWREFVPLAIIGNSPAPQCLGPITGRTGVPKRRLASLFLTGT